MKIKRIEGKSECFYGWRFAKNERSRLFRTPKGGIIYDRIPAEGRYTFADNIADVESFRVISGDKKHLRVLLCDNAIFIGGATSKKTILTYDDKVREFSNGDFRNIIDIEKLELLGEKPCAII